MPDQPSPAPTRKVASGGIAAAITVVIVWVLGAFFDVDVPPEVASAFTAIIAFATSYLVPEA